MKLSNRKEIKICILRRLPMKEWICKLQGNKITQSSSLLSTKLLIIKKQMIKLKTYKLLVRQANKLYYREKLKQTVSHALFTHFK
jgi:hypothetical protein